MFHVEQRKQRLRTFHGESPEHVPDGDELGFSCLTRSRGDLGVSITRELLPSPKPDHTLHYSRSTWNQSLWCRSHFDQIRSLL